MKIGFVGCGNMATAIIKGIIKKQIIEEENIMASAKTKTTLERVQRELGIKVSMDNSEVVKNSDIVVLAVKPQYYQEVIEQIKDTVSDNQIIISIAPGKTLAYAHSSFPFIQKKQHPYVKNAALQTIYRLKTVRT